MKLSKKVPEEYEELYLELFQSYKEVFAWSYQDLKTCDISIVQHTIPLKGEPQFQNWGLQSVKIQGNEDSEYFLGLVRDLGFLRKEMVTESSSKTIGSYDFAADNLAVLAGIAKDNLSFGVASDTDELLQ